MRCAAAKRKCAMTKEGSKKSQRVYHKGAESTGLGKKIEKGKGKEKGSKKKRK